MHGTNHGGVTLELEQTERKLAGKATFLEKEYGFYEYLVKGVVGVILEDGHANVVLDLSPVSAAPGIELGQVRAPCKFTPPHQLEGHWKSSIKTNGSFSLTRTQPKPHTKSSVFIVHGHDDTAKTKAALLIQRLGLTPIILNDQVNQGQTIIEKFEQHAGEVGFAVVLITPDDQGGSSRPGSVLQPRARQNVILEMGYFVGRLGRSKVCPLYTPKVELPSDLLGVGYISMDPHDAWQMKLAREMKAAGLPVDLNRLAI